MCGQHAKHWRLLGVTQDCVLPVELYVSVDIGVLEDDRVVVVTYDLVAHGIGRLVVNRVTHTPPPVLGKWVSHSPCQATACPCIRERYGMEEVMIAVATPEYRRLQRLLSPERRARYGTTNAGLEEGLDTGQRRGVEGVV